MSTNQQIIDLALAKIDVIEAGDSANNTDSTTMLGILNRMMAEWRERSMDLNWFTQDTLGDTIPIPEWAEEAVIANLAVRAATDFSAAVRPDVAEQARVTRRTVGNIVINQELDNADMGHLPYGGGRLSRYDIETDV